MIANRVQKMYVFTSDGRCYEYDVLDLWLMEFRYHRKEVTPDA